MNVPTRRLSSKDICVGVIDGPDDRHCALGWGFALFVGREQWDDPDFIRFAQKLTEVADLGGHFVDIANWNNNLGRNGEAHKVAAAINRTLDLLEMEQQEAAQSHPTPARELAGV